mmetsp:Transcript_16812/g.42019  ORF Transcript_16812/g.42019 Transcript_16812/m.42019 type:complete len:103 (-) Transcript_16812:3017-3325(-)
MFALRQRILGPAASLAKRSLRSNNRLLEPRFSTYHYASPEATLVVAPNTGLSSTLSTIASNWWFALQETGILMISTLKRRRKMMNKHKLRKRRKKNRMKNKK